MLYFQVKIQLYILIAPPTFKQLILMGKLATTNIDARPPNWSKTRFKRNIFQKQCRLSIQYNKFKQIVQKKIQTNKRVISTHAKLEELIPTQYTCPICLEILVYPASTICGHCFCYQCAEESTLHSSACPICRTDIAVGNISISNALEQIIWKLCQDRLLGENLINYVKRHEDSKIWMEKRHLQVGELKMHAEIDVKDTQNIWCKARVMQIFKNKHQQLTDILVHYKGWDRLYDEVIQVVSQRLAPEGFFTNRTDIPSYKMINDQQQLLRRQVLRNRFMANNLLGLRSVSQNNEPGIFLPLENRPTEQTINRQESQVQSPQLPEYMQNILQPREVVMNRFEMEIIEWINSQSPFTVDISNSTPSLQSSQEIAYNQQNSYLFTSEQEKEP